ncbi:UNVERIFIED_CONTAM: hypothetical protein NCL1_37234 [Trichonephila clavipes]
MRKTPAKHVCSSEDVIAVDANNASVSKYLSVEQNGRCIVFSQEQRIAIVESYFCTKSHCHAINAFQQKYPSETSPNAPTITHLVQQFRYTGSVANRKQTGRALIVKTKVANVETLTKKSNEKTVRLHKDHYGIHILGEQYLGCRKTLQRVTHHWTYNCKEVLAQFFVESKFMTIK